MKPQLTPRAWHGARGWAYAKLLAHNGRKALALRLYLIALFRGCYSPRLAVIIFLQIFLAAKNYRALADTAITWLRLGLRPKSLSNKFPEPA
jgi:hypothetical protein